MLGTMAQYSPTTFERSKVPIRRAQSRRRSTDPFDQATLDALYPTNDDYVDLVKEDAKRLKKAKFLTKEDEKEIVERAKTSGIPN